MAGDRMLEREAVDALARAILVRAQLHLTGGGWTNLLALNRRSYGGDCFFIDLPIGGVIHAPLEVGLHDPGSTVIPEEAGLLADTVKGQLQGAASTLRRVKRVRRVRDFVEHMLLDGAVIAEVRAHEWGAWFEAEPLAPLLLMADGSVTPLLADEREHVLETLTDWWMASGRIDAR